MEDYHFHEGQLPSGYRYNFEQSLFSSEAYRFLQRGSDWISFYILNDKDFLVEGQIHFYKKDSVGKSGIQSPFGGIECSDRLNSKTLFHFVEFFSNKLKEHRCSSLIIIDRPLLYSPGLRALNSIFLQNLGFNIATAEVSSIIEITAKPFAEIIHPRKKRKLAQSSAAKLEFRVLSHDCIEEVYHFIESHRKEKKYTLSITRKHLIDSVEKLRDRYQLFGVFDTGKLVAASVTVRVTDKILYHFISDHVRKIDQARPSLILMEGIYNYCQQNNITMFDLGTSAINGLPNFKLIKFKTELGGQPTPKLTFTKQLH